MDGRVEVVALKYAAHSLLIAAVHLDKRRRNASNCLYAIKRRGVTIGEVVDDDNLVTSIYKFYGCVRTDISRTTSNKHYLIHSLLRFNTLNVTNTFIQHTKVENLLQKIAYIGHNFGLPSKNHAAEQQHVQIKRR